MVMEAYNPPTVAADASGADLIIWPEAAFPFGLPSWLRKFPGQPLTASLIFPSSDATRTTAARLIAEQAAGAGFDLKTAGVSDADFAGALHSGAFDVALISVAAGPDPDRSSLLHTKGSANAGGYSNPDLDTLLESELSAVPSKSASLADVRKPIFGNIEKLVTTDLPIYVLWAPRRYAGFSLTLGGVTAVGAQLDADRDNSFYVSWFVTG